MNRNEVENLRLRKSDDLVKLAADLGYDTYPNQLQCNNGAHVSGLLNFFDDNPGALEAVQEWILNNSDLDEDDDNDGEYRYDTLEECVESGEHLSDCDDDGYCNHCGNQEASPTG